MMRKVVWWIVDFQAKFIWMDLELMGKWMQLLNSIVMDCISFYQCSVKHFSLELHACLFPQQDIFTSSTDQRHLSSAIRKDVCYHEHKCLVWLLRVEKWEDMFTRSTGRNCVIYYCASYQMLNKLSCGVSRDISIFHMVTESSVNEYMFSNDWHILNILKITSYPWLHYNALKINAHTSNMLLKLFWTSSIKY